MDLSDHFPICLEWSKPKGSYAYPFKFNRSWLDDPTFNDWFLNWWSSNLVSDSPHGIEDLCLKLRDLKHATKGWTKDKLASMDSASSYLDQAIEAILSGPSNSILSKDQLAQLTLLNAKRQNILDHY